MDNDRRNIYLIPANSKRGMLILGIFRPIDLLVFGIGLSISLVLLITRTPVSMLETFVTLFPVGITGMLVAPIPNYHNILTFVLSMIDFFTTRQRYIWKGWCANEQFKVKR